jgi:hypothetical protein
MMASREKRTDLSRRKLTELDNIMYKIDKKVIV